ncbi:hypothetical protein [Absidia glauca]|uniref:Retrotransposon gag domain-containing protein n=1 Tax=Absidia glauca TaxID=4829 RepID=A0A163JZG7_ABSGL|nr:hypothetical protein [Absidia glauca]
MADEDSYWSGKVKLPNCASVESVVPWIKHFEKACTFNRIPDSDVVELAPFYLSGHMADWALDSTFTTWDDFKTRIMQRYAPEELLHDHLTALLSFNQHDTESARDYLDRWENLTRRYQQTGDVMVDDSLLIKAFIKGINNVMLKQLMLDKIVKAKTLVTCCGFVING